MIWWFILGILTLLVSFVGLFVHKTSNHADIKHIGCELIREAFNKNGSYQVWQEKLDKNVFHHIVEMGDGKFGDYVVYQNGDTMYEKTVFIPKDGSLKSIKNYIKDKAIRRN